MEFKGGSVVSSGFSTGVDIGTEWNLKPGFHKIQWTQEFVDIGTEWNLKQVYGHRYCNPYQVDIGTEWNLKVDFP